MSVPSGRLRDDAWAIWRAGLDAVRSDRLVRQAVRVGEDRLRVGDELLPLDAVGRIVVVGCGKAGAGMASGLEAALGDRLLEEKRVDGWINVPDDCVRPLKRVHLHAARPAGVNEPAPEGVEGAERILEMVQSLAANDVCLCLISGGGSALLPAPVGGITLADKLAVTRHLSAAGANIQQLNTVRKQLSRIKGGGLARACRAGRLIALIISDVLGDPLDVIASGPTVPDPSTPREALEVLGRFAAAESGISQAVFQTLRQAADAPAVADGAPACRVTNLVIGNNATAVRAAGREAERRGYQTRLEPLEELEGEAEQVGRDLAEAALRMHRAGGQQCLVSGGEPTVRLVDSSRRGRGGRNQQLVLAALERLMQESEEAIQRIVVLSGGTDGEDGPTDAAGAILDAQVLAGARRAGRSPTDALRRNDAYTFFEPLDGLLRTGPTHTNVCDLRIVLARG